MDKNKVVSSGISKKHQRDKFFGRLNDASGAAYIRGLCGDEMEFYLVIENNIVTEVKYYTDGCEFTRVYGRTAARLAFKKTISEVLMLSPQQIIQKSRKLPQAYLHCAILSVSTLHKAISDYLIKP